VWVCMLKFLRITIIDYFLCLIVMAHILKLFEWRATYGCEVVKFKCDNRSRFTVMNRLPNVMCRLPNVIFV
jgi:hypothetical protein